MKLEQGIKDIPVAYVYTSSSDNAGSLKLRRDTSLVVPDDDANDQTIACSSRRINNARNYLFEVKKQAEKSNSLIADLCSMLFGIGLSLLASLWLTLSPYSPEGFWIYTMLLLITLVSFFTWIWLKRTPYMDISNLVDIILGDLPDPEKTQNIRENNGS